MYDQPGMNPPAAARSRKPKPRRGIGVAATMGLLLFAAIALLLPLDLALLAWLSERSISSGAGKAVLALILLQMLAVPLLARPELQHLAPQLIERINGYFGYAAVARLQIIQGPLPHAAPPARRPPAALDAARQRALNKRLESIGDDPLRQALERLGRAVLGKRPP